MSLEAQQKTNSGLIIKLYPFGVLLVSLVLTFFLGQTSFEVSLPSIDLWKILSLAAVILVVNHSWIMTQTELTRQRFKIFATPEEWRDSGKSKASITEEGQFEIDRTLNAHRNTTENTLYYIFLAVVFSFTSPSLLAATIWLLLYPIARLGYTYSYFAGKDGVRGIFMSLALLSMYGLSASLLIGIFSL